MKQQLKISKIKGNPKNPRIIKNDKFKSLKHSIKTMPGYMKLRPVIIDENMMVLGGNMRLKASIDLGKKEIWTDMFTQADCDDMNKVAVKEKRETQTYDEYCDAIIIKDNVTSGEWDWDMLGNEWDNTKLGEWGMDVWQPEEAVDYSILDDIDLGNTLQDKTAGVKRGIVVEFEAGDYDEANDLITKSRKKGNNIGKIVLNAFRNDA